MIDTLRTGSPPDRRYTRHLRVRRIHGCLRNEEKPMHAIASFGRPLRLFVLGLALAPVTHHPSNCENKEERTAPRDTDRAMDTRRHRRPPRLDRPLATRA